MYGAIATLHQVLQIQWKLFTISFHTCRFLAAMSNPVGSLLLSRGNLFRRIPCHQISVPRPGWGNYLFQKHLPSMSSTILRGAFLPIASSTCLHSALTPSCCSARNKPSDQTSANVANHGSSTAAFRISLWYLQICRAFGSRGIYKGTKRGDHGIASRGHFWKVFYTKLLPQTSLTPLLLMPKVWPTSQKEW